MALNKNILIKNLKGNKRRKIMKFRIMHNVKDNRELKKVNDNVMLVVKTRETEDLLDINRQIRRLKENGYKVILQSPKGNKLPSRALGKYTKRHVNIEIGGLRHDQIIAKFTNLKDMMSHTEYVDIPVYEEQHLTYSVPLRDDNGNIIRDKNGSMHTTFDFVPLGNELVFWHKTPKVDSETGKTITKTVEKTVYLDRIYTVTVNGKYCHSKKIKKLAKSFKVPLAAAIDNKVIDPNDESYLLDGFSEEAKDLLNLKYEELDENKKAALYKFFGIKGYKVSDYENFLYSSCNISYFVRGELDLIEKVDAEEFMNMLEMFKIPNAYDIIYDLAEKGMLVHLENYPELQHFEEARFYEDSYRGDEEEDILD
jgi:hypothetical protein